MGQIDHIAHLRVAERKQIFRRIGGRHDRCRGESGNCSNAQGFLAKNQKEILARMRAEGEGEQHGIRPKLSQKAGAGPPGHIPVQAGRGDCGNGMVHTPEARLMMVPMAEARLSAGTGSFEAGGEVLRHYAFRWDFLRRKGNPAQMVLLRVSGDSMQPRIVNNDVVLIDQSQREPVPGRIYAVGVEDMVYLKVLDAMPGKLILTSINPDFAPIEADTSEQLGGLVRIIGRAVWVGRELD